MIRPERVGAKLCEGRGGQQGGKRQRVARRVNMGCLRAVLGIWDTGNGTCDPAGPAGAQAQKPAKLRMLPRGDSPDMSAPARAASGSPPCRPWAWPPAPASRRRAPVAATPPTPPPPAEPPLGGAVARVEIKHWQLSCRPDHLGQGTLLTYQGRRHRFRVCAAMGAGRHGAHPRHGPGLQP